MNIGRAKAEAAATDYFDELYRKHGGIPENHQIAIDLRMQFFTKYILKRRTNDYKTPVEKDWAYIAKREFRHDVNIRALADGGALGLVTCMLRMYMVKKFICWPFLPVAISTYVYRQR